MKDAEAGISQYLNEIFTSKLFYDIEMIDFDLTVPIHFRSHKYNDVNCTGCGLSLVH